MSKKMKPLNNRIIVKVDKSDTKKTKGGLELSTDLKNRNQFKKNIGIVESIGTYVGEEYSEIEVGDKVLFTEHAGHTVNEEDDYLYRVIQDINVEVIL